jgi:hypothetical protein
MDVKERGGSEEDASNFRPRSCWCREGRNADPRSPPPSAYPYRSNDELFIITIFKKEIKVAYVNKRFLVHLYGHNLRDDPIESEPRFQKIDKNSVQPPERETRSSHFPPLLNQKLLSHTFLFLFFFFF